MKSETQPSQQNSLGAIQDPFGHPETCKQVSSLLETGGNILPSLIDLGSQPRTALVDDVLASAYLGVTPGTLSVWRCTGRYSLRFIKVGRRIRYRVGDLLDFVESRVHIHTSSQSR